MLIGKDKALLSDTGNGFRDITKPLSKICNKPLILMKTVAVSHSFMLLLSINLFKRRVI